MKKILLLIFAMLLNIFGISAQKSNTEWFEDARFGMFIHFGPYSVLGAGEWNMDTWPITKSEYAPLQQIFNPQAFDPAVK